jgi:3-keto-disaccharide hydrolase
VNHSPRWLPGRVLVILAIVVSPCGAQQETGFVSLFDGKTLDGWIVRGGKAEYTVEDGVIVGTSRPNTSNTFLCTLKDYGDFVLEYEIKADSELNSGVQIRSQVFDKDTVVNLGNGRSMTIPAGRVHGYQVEFDANLPERAWMAGIYDEGRRDWLYPGSLGGDARSFTAQGKRLFRPGTWNQVRVEARGPSIKTFFNGQPRAEITDNLTPSGFIGLQVHSVHDEARPLHVRWRNLRIKTLD